jgi:hypothetical protein
MLVLITLNYSCKVLNMRLHEACKVDVKINDVNLKEVQLISSIQSPENIDLGSAVSKKMGSLIWFINI